MHVWAIVVFFAIAIIAACSSPTTDVPAAEPQSVVTTVQTALSDDSAKIEDRLRELNNENITFFTDVRVEKRGGQFQVSLQVTEDVTSQVFLDLLSMGVSTIVYNTTTDFDTVTITYVDAANKQLGIVTVPKKAAGDIVEYTKAHPSAAENPYFKTFNSVVTRMYDPAVPELFPTAMMEEPTQPGGSNSDDQHDYAALLARPVTHLDLTCSGSDNWDADADDDGITYYIEPRSADDRIIPIEGTITTRVYERSYEAPTSGYGLMEYQWRPTPLATVQATLTGNTRFKQFSEWSGYKLRLNWNDIPDYDASSSDWGGMEVTFTTTDGQSFAARTSRDSDFGQCQLRETNT